MASYEVTLILPPNEANTENKHVIQCDEEVYILDQAEEDGIEIPYSCRAGSCSSCVGIVQEGEINQDDQNFLDDEDMDNNFVLTCAAYPISDCTILTHQENNFSGKAKEE